MREVLLRIYLVCLQPLATNIPVVHTLLMAVAKFDLEIKEPQKGMRGLGGL